MSEPFLAEIIMFGGNFAPRGWALCNGQILSIAQNTALFSLLGTTYGGNGQTTFGLPDMRGRVPIHPGQGPGLSNYDLGQVAGVENTTLLISNLPAHTHAVTATVNAADSTQSPADVPTGNVPYGASGGPGNFAGTANVQMKSDMVGVTVGIAGSNMPFSILQPYLCVNFIIAIQGIFPSRN